VDARGELIGALMVGSDDEVFAITSAGGVMRTTASEINRSGRQTMGVRLVNLAPGQTLVGIARNAEVAVQGEAGQDDDDAEADLALDPSLALALDPDPDPDPDPDRDLDEAGDDVDGGVDEDGEDAE